MNVKICPTQRHRENLSEAKTDESKARISPLQNALPAIPATLLIYCLTRTTKPLAGITTERLAWKDGMIAPQLPIFWPP